MKILLMEFDPTVDPFPTRIQDWIPTDPGILVLIGALLLVSIGVFIWAAFFRKRTHRPRYQPRADGAEPLSQRISSAWKGRGFPFRKHRRRHHREKRRNPTLAEAGGLPPVRDEGNPPP